MMGPTMPRFSLRVFIKVLSYGENRAQINGPFPTIHAEDDAINRLPQRCSKKLKKINLIVIRSNIGGSVGNSRPCSKCVECLFYKLPLRGYILDRIHYSSKGGVIISQKFSRFIDESEHHVTKLMRGVK